MSIALQTKTAPTLETSFVKKEFSSSLHRFTVDQYHRLIDVGVFGKDRVQLLEGWIADKKTHNPPHATAIGLTQTALAPFLTPDWHTRTNSAVTTADSEPEPDIAVVQGTARQYSRRHPGPKDIGMIVEVGDATLRDDQTIQYRIYPRCRIPVYWIVNLVEEKVEVYTKPKGGKTPHYQERRDYAKNESVPLIIDGTRLGLIPVKELMP